MEPSRDIPEGATLEVGDTGKTLTRVEALRAPAVIQHQLWFWGPEEDGRRDRVWPFEFSVEDGEEWGPPKTERPLMPREKLESVGSNDVRLTEEFARYFGRKPDPELAGADTYDVQAERKRVFDLVMGAAYRETPHPKDA